MAIDLGLATIVASLITVVGTIIGLFLRSRSPRAKNKEVSSETPTKEIRSEKTVKVRAATPKASKASRSIPVSETPKEKRSPQRIEKILIPRKKKYVDADDWAEYEFQLDEGDEIVGSVASEDYFNVFLFDTRNHNKWLGDEDFEYLDGDEDVKHCGINTEIDRTGNWYLVVQNEDKEEGVEVEMELKQIVTV